MTVCMVGGPALLFAGNALHPVNHKTDEATWLAGIAAHRSQWYLAHLIIFIGIPLFVPAVAGVLQIVREQGARWAESGALLTGFGLFATEAFVTAEGFVSWQMTTGDADAPQMVALLERFNDSPATFVPIGLGTAVLTVGLAALAVGLIRARVMPLAWPLAWLTSRVIAIGALLAGAASSEYQQAVIASADVLQLIGLAGVATHLGRGAGPGSAFLATANGH